MRVSWLADVLRAEHLTVVELDGWQGRGRELKTVEGIVAHHTATSTKSLDRSVAQLLRDGRPDLAGPLAQLGLDRQGRFWLIADGRCNHNGYGTWGNQSIGIEAFNDGRGEPWPSVQTDAWAVGCAAICRRLGLGVDHVLGHRETDPTRKVDPVGIDMDWFRRRVADCIAKPANPAEEADDMDRTAIPSWMPRQENGRVGFYRLGANNEGVPLVWAYNGAPLIRVDGTALVPYMELVGLTSPPVGIEETGDGAVVVCCGDGGVIDVAKRPAA